MSENSFTDEFGIAPEYVNVARSAVGGLNATNAALRQSAVQRLTADSVQASNSALALANASTLELSQSAIGVAAGDYIRVEDSSVFLLLAPRVSGNVKATITLPAAFALGAGYFIARQLFARLGRRAG